MNSQLTLADPWLAIAGLAVVLAAAACAVVNGARLIRVHDVAASVQYFTVWRGITGAPGLPDN